LIRLRLALMLAYSPLTALSFGVQASF
jgi:hypothetical protein